MKKRFFFWQDGSYWIGYLEEYPDYMTQGESLEELKENLKSLYEDIQSDEIPSIIRAGEIENIQKTGRSDILDTAGHHHSSP